MDKINNKSVSFVKIGIIYTVSNLIVKGISFLTTPIFTRLMSQSDYGQFSSIASWANIISIIVTLGLYSSISRAKYDYGDRINEYMSTIIILGNIVTAICWVIIESRISFFENIFSMDRIYIRAILIYAMFFPSVQTLIAKNRIFNEYKQVIGITWVTLLASTGASVALVIIMANKLTGIVFGNYLVVAIVDSIFWLFIVIKGRYFSFKYCKYACILSVPLVFHQLSGVLLNSSDRIIIEQLCGAKDAALYSLAYTIAMVITVLLSSLNQAWIPWFYDRLEIKEFSRIRLAARKYSTLFTIGCIFLMLIGPELVLLFGGKSYLEAVYVIPPVCMAIELQFFYTLYVNIEFFLKKMIYVSLATLGATTINIGLNYLLIPKFGYMLAAYTTIAGYFFMLLFHYSICRKIQYKNLFDEKAIIINILLCLTGMISALILYKFNIIRIIVIFIVLVTSIVILYKNKENLLKFVKN